MNFLVMNNILIFWLLILSLSASAQQNAPFSLLFYNVENLFDTINSPQVRDGEFTPEGSKEWNTWRYYQKLNNLSKVIIAAGKWNPPDIIGVAEIENKKCLRDLVGKTVLSKMRYSIIHHESEDRRGIDVAMAYNPETFQVLHDTALPVRFKKQPQLRTRDILHVTGIIREWNDTIHVFMCHFPSRYGGTAQSEYKRIAAMNVLIDAISTVYDNKPHAQIVILGDFNDYPHNDAPQLLISSLSENKIIKVTDSLHEGTYVYKSVWNELDHCYISETMSQNHSYYFSIISHDFMLQEFKNGKTAPRRTYRGSYYLGGYSDHLPIMFRMQKKLK
ncbi:MAG: endonuclease [Bacteroidales bacterium]|jgi:predicted extracellular nuclease|nr:endonuclease [Bacteroidales bacterium]